MPDLFLPIEILRLLSMISFPAMSGRSRQPDCNRRHACNIPIIVAPAGDTKCRRHSSRTLQRGLALSIVLARPRKI